MVTYRYPHSNGLKVPTTGYADDHLHPLRIENVQQVQEIHTVYSNFQKVSALKVNIAKTTKSRTATYEAVHVSVQHKFEAINSSFVDLCHRRQLIQQVFLPSFNHIFMAFGHDSQWGEEIDKIIIKLLWTRKREGQVHKGRTLIAKKRLTMDFTFGGLKVFFSKEIAEGLVLNTQRLTCNKMLRKGKKHLYLQ
jgi:hypothetical protein